MNDSTILSDKLYKEMMDLVERGDEKALRDYIASHIEEFPEGARGAVMMALVEEAVGKSNERDGRVADLKEAGLGELGMLDKAQEEAEKKKKLLDIKEGA